MPFIHPSPTILVVVAMGLAWTPDRYGVATCVPYILQSKQKLSLSLFLQGPLSGPQRVGSTRVVDCPSILRILLSLDGMHVANSAVIPSNTHPCLVDDFSRSLVSGYVMS